MTAGERRVYASTACVSAERDLWETLAAYRQAGIRAVELGATRLDDSSRLSDRLRELPLDLAVHNYFPPPRDPFVLNLASPDAEIRRRSLDLARAAIDLCSAVDAPFYSVHAGFAVDPVGWSGTSFAFPDPGAGAVDAATERFSDAYAQLVAIGDAAGVAVLVENNVCTPELHGKLLLQTADEFLDLIERVPETRLLVDTGHLNVSARTLGFDPADFVAAIGGAVGAWHLHANDGVSDSHRPARPDWWALPLLDLPELASTPVVVEARFRTDAELAAYVKTLRTA